jgi:hypothetical protein
MQEKNPGLNKDENICSLSFDTSEMTSQLNQFSELLMSQFPNGVPNELIENLLSLAFDVMFTEGRSTLRTDGILEVVHGLRLGTSFESLRAAVLAGKWDVHREPTLAESH